MQQTLFAPPVPPATAPGPHARTTDPATSKVGPRQLKRDTLLVLRLVVDNPGMTTGELTRRLMIDEVDRVEQALPHGALTAGGLLSLMFEPDHDGPTPIRCVQLPNKRVPDLHGLGYVEATVPRRCQITGSFARSWLATDEGRAALEYHTNNTPTKGNT